MTSLALTSYQISPRKAVNKPDGNHWLSPGGGRDGMESVVARLVQVTVPVVWCGMGNAELLVSSGGTKTATSWRVQIKPQF